MCFSRLFELNILASVPFRYMSSFGWIEPSSDELEDLRRKNKI